jgi:predicted amidohydrolase
VLPYLEEIPNPSEENICKLNNTNGIILKKISCLAFNYNITLVVNMGEIQYCDPKSRNCPVDGRLQYNTQVAFGENGNLLAKYHKRLTK